MKVLHAIATKDLPESVITRKARLTCYGYTVWKADVITAIARGKEEIEYFKQLREQGVCDKVDEIIANNEDDIRLLDFMERHGLDVIFEDLEDTNE